MTKAVSVAAVGVVVSGDPTQLDILAGLLAKAGLEARAYAGAEAALAAMNPADPPDLVVTDLCLPGLDGWRFCRLLRSPEYAACNDVPIIVVSAAFAGDHPERIAADIGADAFLSWPVDGKAFVAQVQVLLQGKEARRRLAVLVVEDDPDFGGLLVGTFAAHGYRADKALTVREAEAAFGKKAYDLAVLDYHLPDGTGDALLEAFRTRRSDCVCLMMTGDPEPVLALDWMKRGAAAHLHKPFAPEFLIELCAKVRRERALQRAENLLEARTRELRESEEKYRGLFESISDAAFVHELEEDGQPGRFLEVNEAACWRLGYTREELLCLRPRDIADPAEYARLAPWRGQLGDRGNVLIETIHRTKDGRKIPVEGNIRCITYRGRPAALSVSRDITERKRMELALQRRDAILDAAVGASGLLLTSETPAEALGEIVRLLGEASGQDRAYYFAWQTDFTTGKITIRLRHEWVREGIAPRQDNPLLQALPFDQAAPYSWERLRQGLEVCALVRDLPASEREALEPQEIVSFLLMPIMVNGVPEGFIGFDNCRTEHAWTAGERGALGVVAINLGAALARSRAEVALRASEKRHRSLIEHSPDAIGIYQDDKLVFVNPATVRMLGAKSEEELLGLTSAQVVHPEDRPAALERVRRLMAGESGLYPAEVRYVRRDGSVVWGEVIGSLVQFGGQPAFQFVGRDMTARKKMEDALRVKEWAISDSINAVALADFVGNLTFVNPAFLRIWGYASETEVIGRNATEFWESRDMVADVTAVLQQQGHWRGELQGKRRDGSRFAAEAAASLVLDEAGRPLCLLGVFADITDRKAAEEALRRSEAQYRLLADNASDNIWVLSLADFRLTYVSPSSTRMFGFTPEESIQMNLAEQLPPESLELVKNVLAEELEKERDSKVPRDRSRVIELEQCVKGGGRIWMQITTSFLRDEAGQPVQVLGITRDITERRRAEAALRASEQLYRATTDSLPDGVHVVGPDLRLQLINQHLDQWCDNLGLARGRAGQPLAEVFPFLPERVKEEYANVFRTGLMLVTEETTQVGNREITTETRKIPVLETGTVERVITIVRDITERKRVEEAFRRQEVRYRTIVDHLNDAFYIHDFRGRITDLNENACRQTGYSREDLLAGGLPLIDSPEEAAAMPERMAALIEKGALLFEGAHRRKDGTPVYVSVSARVISREGDGRAQSFVRDISELKRAEEEKEKLQTQLVQAQKMESVGRLAGGVAHDFNNMLQVILGSAALALRDLPPESPLRERLQEIQGCAQRSADLTRQLLAFARRQTIAPKVLDLNDAVADMLKMLRRLIGEGIELAWLPGAGLGLVHVDPSQVDQILALKRLFMSGYTASVIAHHGVLDPGVHFVQKPFAVQALADKLREVLNE